METSEHKMYATTKCGHLVRTFNHLLLSPLLIYVPSKSVPSHIYITGVVLTAL